ncbi:Outer membrane vitamin B12 receptor BtuB [Hyphomicrobium sulfonivorans]|uniref:Outer membrane vitamin B12 receptor BtuB n=1 Tax=Hyphomicrobium sulfonivorans TaxID=121290 RepID=A0A109BKD2_HYPSL|nr:TonB-dependent receptor [Hyphomicrobium sulfonivorans]KWT70261.1 Outer membrane vitamin B12 receptor BtuB [Hyphomicrobium sulfonivorans]
MNQPSPGPAQDAANVGNAGKTGAAGTLNLSVPDEIGSRLSLTPMQTPASVEVINREQILKRGDTKVIDAVTRATGITAMGGPNNGGTALVSRGFAGNSSVAQLYDGTRIDTMGLGSLSFPFDTWMAERIEVLRGPTSVLYGAGSIGGVVNVVTKKPNPRHFEHEAFASYGSDNKRQFAVGSGGPISDALAYRFDISSQMSDGWVERGDSESLAVSGQVRFAPTSDFSLLLTYDYARQEPMKYWGTPMINGGIDKRMRFANYNTEDASVVHHDKLARAKAEWRVADNIVLRNELYHVAYDRHWFAVEQFNWDNGRVRRTGFTDSRHWREQVGNRFDATITNSLFGMAMQTVVGADATRNNYETLAFNRSGTSYVDPFNPVPGHSSLYTPNLNGAGQFSDMTQTGLFAENRIEITRDLSVVSGLRYDQYALDYENRANGLTNKNDFNYLSWRAGVVYDVLPGLALYGQYATGSDPESVMYSRDDERAGRWKSAQRLHSSTAAAS